MPLTTPDGRIFCTSFSINQAERLWATAGHCAVYALENSIEVHIGGQWATVVYIWFDALHDVAVFQSGASAKALPLAHEAPDVGDTIDIRGFPYGLPETRTKGMIGARIVPLDGAPVSDILDITVAPGNSGSPVLRKGKVVGILWGRFLNSEHALSIPWEALRQFLSPYWES